MHMCVPTIYEEKEGGTHGVQTRWHNRMRSRSTRDSKERGDSESKTSYYARTASGGGGKGKEGREYLIHQ